MGNQYRKGDDINEKYRECRKLRKELEQKHCLVNKLSTENRSMREKLRELGNLRFSELETMQIQSRVNLLENKVKFYKNLRVEERRFGRGRV